MKNRFNKRNHLKQSGFAMIFAILIVVTMTLILASALKNSDLFKNLSVVQTQQAFQALEVESQLRGISMTELASTLDPWLLPSKDEPGVIPTVDNAYKDRLISNNAGAGAGGDFDSWVNANFVDKFNSNSKNAGKTLQIRCISQQDPTDVKANREPCTNQRLHDPKLFEIVLRQTDSVHHTVTSITQEVQISRSLVSQYTYLVTDSKNPVALSRVVFNSPVGIFFREPYSASAQMLFTSCPPGGGCLTPFADPSSSLGTVLNAPLVTNLVSDAQLIDYLQPTMTASRSVREIRYAQYPKNLMSTIQTSYAAIREGKFAGLTTNNAANPLTAAESAAAQECYDTWNASTPTSDCSIRVEYSSFNLNGCNISLKTKISWSYKGANVIIPPPVYNSLSEYTVIAPTSQATFGGEVLFLPGTAYIKEVPAPNTNGPSSQLCANLTLMADNLVIQNSLNRTSAAINSALFAKHTISLASDQNVAQDDAYFSDGNRLWAMKAAAGGGMHTRATANFNIDASMIADSQTGGFVVPATYYDGIPSYLRFGLLNITGMVISSETFATSAFDSSWHGSGFSKVVMGQGGTLSEKPPPGMSFIFSTGLVSVLITTSVTSTAIPDAISYVSQ